MKDNVHQFVEEMALMLEERGFPRMAGRVAAWLMICQPKHQSMTDLVNVLEASKSSVSTALRMLIQFDLVRKVSLRGERKDHYVLKEEIWSNTMQEALERIAKFKAIVSKGLQMLDESDQVRLQVLRDMKEAYDFWELHIPPLQEKWEQEKMKK
ncbi:MAG: GbsR/MarR family transcriptional regulator [Candidatus Cyclobacteriaceae bacterium M3_2C_046]